MKKIVFFAFLFVVSITHGQTLTIPDSVFNSLLLSSGTANGIAIDSSGDAIAIDANGDGLIQEEEADEVRQLHVDGAAITNLEGIAGFANLRILSCTANSLTALDLSENLDLREVNCAGNAIAALNITGLQHLEILNCSGNNIAQLDCTGLEYLQTLSCAQNNLTELDLSDCPALSSLICNDNQITYINIKNGTGQIPTYAQNMWGNNPLAYVCADDIELDAVDSLLALNSYSGVNVNTYCSFEPGGDYNTISGSVLFDIANDGCDATDPPHAFMKLKMNDGIADCYTFTDIAGQYNFYTGTGAFNVMPDFENESFFTASPTSADATFTAIDNSIYMQDFCVTANGSQNDVEVVMIPLNAAVPGGDASYKIVYKNKGNTTIASGGITCEWDTDIIYDLVSITPWPDFAVQDFYRWNYANLRPFENREIIMTFTLNDQVVSVGDEVPFVAEAEVGTGNTDVISQDNSFTYTQKMVAASQDNFIVCVEGESAPATAIGDYLHYAINFTNTGTQMVNNVVVAQVFDPTKFDISTLEILNSSHSMTARVSGDAAEYIMRDANLVNGNGHGNVLVKIKTRPNLQQNSSVTGQSSIFFDFNTPLQTNVATTTFETLNTGNFERDTSVLVTPNPVVSIVTITAQSLIKEVTLYNVQGRQLEVRLVNDAVVSIDLTKRATGMYFVKVVTEKGVSIQKVVRQ